MFLILCWMGSNEGKADTFGWRFPVDGAFSEPANWFNFPNGGYPKGSDGSIFSAGGAYTVTCNGASSGVTSVGDDVTFQLDGGYTVGEIHVGGAIVLRGSGALSGGPFSVDGSIVVLGAKLTMNGLSFPTVLGQTKITGNNGAHIQTSGLVDRLNKPLLESGAEWHHTGELNAGWCFVNTGALLAADKLTATPADLNGGRIQAGTLIANGVIAKNGASLSTDSVILTGVKDTLLDGGSTRWMVSGNLDATSAQLGVQTGASLSAGSLTGVGGFYTISGSGSQLGVVGSIAGAAVTVADQGHASAANLKGASILAQGAGSLFTFTGLAEDTGMRIVDGGKVSGGPARAPMSEAAENGANFSVLGTNSTLLLDGNLSAGPFGQAGLEISNGGHVECAQGLLDGGRTGGYSSGSVSEAVSYWLARNGLIVGDVRGQATLNLSAGGRVETRGAAAAVGLDVRIDGGSSATPSAWDARLTPFLGVGVGGKGLLSTLNHGRVLANDLLVGVQPGADGTVEAIGSGSSLEVAGTLEVGKSGHGQLLVTSGAAATAQDVRVGSQTGTNLLHLMRTNSTLTIARSFHIGEAGTGRLLVEQGARVIMTGFFSPDGPDGSGQCSIGQQSGAVGVATLEGAGSSLACERGALLVGAGGNGTLTVSNGAEVNFEQIVVGGSAGSSGTATISGANSVMRTLNRVRIGGAVSTAPVPGEVTVASGALLRPGFNLDIFRTGILRLTGGSAVVGQTSEALHPGVLIVANQGTVHLGGQVIGSVQVRIGGKFLPGSSPGRAAIEGDLTFDPGTALEMELGGTEPGVGYDQIEATGSVVLAGDLNVAFRDGFAATNGQIFDLARGAALTSAFSNITVSGVAPGFTYSLAVIGGTTLRLTATSVGLPTTEPALIIAPLQSSGLKLSWPDYVSGWVLQQTTSLVINLQSHRLK